VSFHRGPDAADVPLFGPPGEPDGIGQSPAFTQHISPSNSTGSITSASESNCAAAQAGGTASQRAKCAADAGPKAAK
jgi:hypothetical protein